MPRSGRRRRGFTSPVFAPTHSPAADLQPSSAYEATVNPVKFQLSPQDANYETQLKARPGSVAARAGVPARNRSRDASRKLGHV